MFRHISQSGQTLGNINEKHRETSNVSEFGRKHFCFLGSKFRFRNNVSTGGQTWKHLRKHRESQMFPQQCFLVCPGLKSFPSNISYKSFKIYNVPICKIPTVITETLIVSTRLKPRQECNKQRSAFEHGYYRQNSTVHNL